jgi:tetratricopeptide (TPR) repeat protein
LKSDKKSNTAILFFRRAELYKSENDISNAEADYLSVTDNDKDNLSAWQNLLDIYLNKKGDKNKADGIKYCTEIIRLKPDSSDAFHKRAGIFEAAAEYDKAVADYTSLLGMESDKEPLYMARAGDYTQLKSYRKALADYEKVIKLNPASTDAYWKCGDIYYALGDARNCIINYNTAGQLAGTMPYSCFNTWENAIRKVGFDSYFESPKLKGGQCKLLVKDMEGTTLTYKSFHNPDFEYVVKTNTDVIILPAEAEWPDISGSIWQGTIKKLPDGNIFSLSSDGIEPLTLSLFNHETAGRASLQDVSEAGLDDYYNVYPWMN